MSELIKYQNGVTIEVAAPQGRTVPATDAAVKRLQSNFEAAVRSLEPVIRPLQETLGKLMAETKLTQAELKLGVSFTAEGNIFITKATAEANLEMTLTFERS